MNDRRSEVDVMIWVRTRAGLLMTPWQDKPDPRDRVRGRDDRAKAISAGLIEISGLADLEPRNSRNATL
ncbi:hypothetical protein ACIBO4_18770 [Streptomyces sp. NPDC050149]|uniref:hypothetical protein n=1 Tax=unclassified Streptomyces TaxID=2593676 RepID=UPI002E3385ED|nr:hypothetical protein [Streptomyces sp. NBC_01358]